MAKIFENDIFDIKEVEVADYDYDYEEEEEDDDIIINSDYDEEEEEGRYMSYFVCANKRAPKKFKKGGEQ